MVQQAVRSWRKGNRIRWGMWLDPIRDEFYRAHHTDDARESLLISVPPTAREITYRSPGKLSNRADAKAAAVFFFRSFRVHRTCEKTEAGKASNTGAPF